MSWFEKNNYIPSHKLRINGENEHYCDHAWTSFVAIILFTMLAIFFWKHFHSNDSFYAYPNHKGKSYKACYQQTTDKENAATQEIKEEPEDEMK